MDSSIVGAWRYDDVVAEFRPDNTFDFRSPSRGHVHGSFSLGRDVAKLGGPKILQDTSPTEWYLKLNYDQPSDRWLPSEIYCLEELTSETLSFRLIGIHPTSRAPVHSRIDLTRLR